jgi:hypothetical protein
MAQLQEMPQLRLTTDSNKIYMAVFIPRRLLYVLDYVKGCITLQKH